MASSNEMKAAAEPVKEDSAPRVVCNICVAKGEKSASSTVCPFCVAKAAALDRIKAAGGDILEALEESQAKPFATVKAEYLDMVKTAGGCVMKTVAKEDGEGNPVARVTVKLPESYMQGVLTLPPPVPLVPRSGDYFERKPHLTESIRIGAVLNLYTIARQEKILASFYKNGYGTMDLEVVDFY